MYRTPGPGRDSGRGRGRGPVNGRQGGRAALISNSVLGGRGGQQQQRELQSMMTTTHRSQSSNPSNIIHSSSYDSRLFGVNYPPGFLDPANSPFCRPVAASNSGEAVPAAAAAVPSQQGDATSTSNTPEEVDHFSIQAQMVLLMDKNNSSKNANTFDAKRAKEIYNQVTDKRAIILDKVGEERPGLVEEVASVLDAPLTNGTGQRVGKTHYVTKLAQIWMAVKDVASLVDGGGRRSQNLDLFIGTMKNFERLAKEEVTKNVSDFRVFKSERMPAGELERGYLGDGGVALAAGEYPTCPNPKCGHGYLLDAFPGNATAKAKDEAATKEYVELCNNFAKWKKRQGPQPKDALGNLVQKMPTPQNPSKLFGRCHCGQNKSDPRNGDRCIVGCVYNNIRYKLGTCPLCKCTCNAYFDLARYRTMMIANSFDNNQQQQQGVQNSQEEARAFLEGATNVNMMQQATLSQQHQQRTMEGSMVASASALDSIYYGGALAQASHMLRNKPTQPAIRELRKTVDNVQHPAGPSHTSVGDMNTFGRASAAEKRMSNNGLNGYVPPGMTDEQALEVAMQASTAVEAEEKEQEDALLQVAMMMSNEENQVSLYYVISLSIIVNDTNMCCLSTTRKNAGEQFGWTEEELSRKMPAAPSCPAAAAASTPSNNLPLAATGNNDTPAYVVSTRAHIGQHRRNNRGTMTKTERKRAAKVLSQLSRPHNATLVNELQETAELDTPERAKNLLEFVEDMEEDSDAGD